MSTTQIESLWQFIKSLNLSKANKEWLVEKLIEPETATTEQNTKEQSKSEYELAWEEVETGQVSEPFTTTEDLFKHLGI